MGSNDSDNKKLIISVESRKGGVGKTTAALCLAKLLLEKGYAVLFLDLDITGTDATDIGESFYWKDILHPVTVGKKTEPANLIELFHNDFMSGKLPQEIKYKIDQINLLGSHIYNNKQDDDSITCIEKPGVLFDALHGYWLLEFIESVIEQFESFVNSENNEQKVAVILDNSPGYMGLSPIIHEWLTDNGPVLNKFLMVSSLDRQDLRACEISVNKLHKLLEDKSDAGDLFYKLSEGLETDFSIEEKHQKFLMKLATFNKDNSLVKSYANQKNADPKEVDKEKNNQENKKQEKPFQEYRNNPGFYIATVINKVPEDNEENLYPYEFKKIIPINAFQSSLAGGDNNFINEKRMISYISGIKRQFHISENDYSNSAKESYETLLALCLEWEPKLSKMEKEYSDLLKASPIHFSKKRLEELIAEYNDLLGKALEIVFQQDNDQYRGTYSHISENWLLSSNLSLGKMDDLEPSTVYAIKEFGNKPFNAKNVFLNRLENSMSIISLHNSTYEWFFKSILVSELETLAEVSSFSDLLKEIMGQYGNVFSSMMKKIFPQPSTKDWLPVGVYSMKVSKTQAQILAYPKDMEFILDFLRLIVRNPKDCKKYRDIGYQVIIERTLSHEKFKKMVTYENFESVLSGVVNLWEINK